MDKPQHWNGEYVDALFRILVLWREHRRAGPLPSDGTATYELIRVIDEVFAPRAVPPEEQAVLDAARRWSHTDPGTGGYGAAVEGLLEACERAFPKPEFRTTCALEGCTASASVFYTNRRCQTLPICPGHKDWLEAYA